MINYPLLYCILVLVLDQATKYAVIKSLPYYGFVEVLPFFKLVHVYNYGVSFSLLSALDARWWLVGVSLLITSAIIFLWRRSPSFFDRVCYASIVGGALGNVIDRIYHGAVVDFLYFHIGVYGYPAFNVADSAIVCAVLALLLKSYFHKAGI